jgi:NADPH2:quinone reductase
MLAFVLHPVGDEPQVEEIAAPLATEDGQAMVPVVAAGVNPVDLVMAGPMFADYLPVPRVVGMEAVVELGGAAAYVESVAWTHGSFAEFTVIDPRAAIALPEGLAVEQAFTIGVSGLAGWLALTAGDLRAGESVLVLGANGAAGQVAVQAARLRGARSVAGVAREHGPLADLLRDADLVIDAAGHDLLSAALAVGHKRIVSIAAAPGTDGVIAYNNFERSTDEKRAAFLTMAHHVAAGELVVPTRTFPLTDALTAWRAQATSPHCKQVIVVR